MTQEPQVPAGPEPVTALIEALRKVEIAVGDRGPRTWLFGAEVAKQLGLPGPGAYTFTAGIGAEAARWRKR